MINILIRTSYRPTLFKRCLESIYSQPHGELRIICSYDDDRCLEYIPENIERIRVYKSTEKFFFDGYCNSLKEMVTSGWFFFLDEDDYLLPNALLKIERKLRGDGMLCQFRRGHKTKPSDSMLMRKKIIRGKVGMPCLILHHSKKNIAYLDGSLDAPDYFWIKEVADKVKLTYVPIPLVMAERRGNGFIET